MDFQAEAQGPVQVQIRMDGPTIAACALRSRARWPAELTEGFAPSRPEGFAGLYLPENAGLRWTIKNPLPKHPRGAGERGRERPTTSTARSATADTGRGNGTVGLQLPDPCQPPSFLSKQLHTKFYSNRGARPPRRARSANLSDGEIYKASSPTAPGHHDGVPRTRFRPGRPLVPSSHYIRVLQLRVKE